MPAAPLPDFEEARLRSLHSLQLLNTAPSIDLDNLVQIAAKIMDMPVAALSLVAETTQWFKASYGLPDLKGTPRDQAFCAYTILDPKSLLVVPDATADQRVADNELVTGPRHIRSYAGAPLLVKDNLPIGALCVIDAKPRAFSEEDLNKLENLARVVSSNIRLHGLVACMRTRVTMGEAAFNVSDRACRQKSR